ncbi:hypothetical protein FKM82_016238 [Ascaphus truei]
MGLYVMWGNTRGPYSVIYARGWQTLRWPSPRLLSALQHLLSVASYDVTLSSHCHGNTSPGEVGEKQLQRPRALPRQSISMLLGRTRGLCKHGAPKKLSHTPVCTPLIEAGGFRW